MSIPNDPNLTTDPFQFLSDTLATVLMQQCPTLKYVTLGWPDPKWLENTGVNLPSVFLVNVSETGKSMTSRLLKYAQVQNADGTYNVYNEVERMTYLLQITLLTTNPQDRLDIGWAIKSYLTDTIQLQISPVDTARFIFRDDRMPPGRDNLYQRDITFEVSARMLSGVVAHPNTTQNFEWNIEGGSS